jgi:hypothetical protein
MTKALLVAAAFVAFLGFAKPAAAGSAQGYSRPVNIWLLNTFLAHTYEYYSGYGYASFGGTADGGNVNQSTSTIHSGELTCMQKSGDLTYLVTGVCHQGTNRGLYQTSIDWVINWNNPSVDGSGASYASFCHMGSWFPFGPCDGAPC